MSTPWGQDPAETEIPDPEELQPDTNLPSIHPPTRNRETARSAHSGMMRHTVINSWRNLSFSVAVSRIPPLQSPVVFTVDFKLQHRIYFSFLKSRTVNFSLEGSTLWLLFGIFKSPASLFLYTGAIKIKQWLFEHKHCDTTTVNFGNQDGY